MRNNTIQTSGRGGYFHCNKATYVVGKVDYVRMEYAYIVAPDQCKDILVLQKNLLSARDKDLVKVQLLPPGRRKRPTGIVVEIIERNTMPIIGRIIEVESQPKAIIEQRQMSYIVCLEGDNIPLLQVNDKVIIKLTSFPSNNHHHPTGRVVKHLGPAGTHEVEMHAIMAEFGLNNSFPENVLENLQHIPTVVTTEAISN